MECGFMPARSAMAGTTPQWLAVLGNQGKSRNEKEVQTHQTRDRRMCNVFDGIQGEARLASAPKWYQAELHSGR